jgi:hypothetical protein
VAICQPVLAFCVGGHDELGTWRGIHRAGRLRVRDGNDDDPELPLPSIPDLFFPEVIGVVVQILVVALFLVAMGARC